MMNNQMHGAHEYMDVHEVLSDTINKINQIQLYRPYCRDPELAGILDRQMPFMINEYNQMAQALNGMGAPALQGNQYQSMDFTTQYGMVPTQPSHPNTVTQQINDQDIASGVLGCHKSSASLRMMSALECTNREMRGMLIQGAVNCAEAAYEMFGYMNKKNYYQVPTLPENLAQTYRGQYQPLTANQPPQQ